MTNDFNHEEEATGDRKIAVLDFGGQYAHLIASRIRRLGAYSEILNPRHVEAANLEGRYAGLIFSGGPSSVYEPGALRCDIGLLSLGLPILGICYGHQLLTLLTGGRVRAAEMREYGAAKLKIHRTVALFEHEQPDGENTVWMSHSDEVISIAPDFTVLASTTDCPFAAVGSLERKIFGLQFHPEVDNTERGNFYLLNFIRLCGVEKSWSLENFLEEELRRIKREAGEQKVFFLLSGGVDSTVAFALLARVLPPQRLIGFHVDTGFMRQDECSQVVKALAPLGVRPEVIDARQLFFRSLANVSDPEQKRHIIGKLFLQVQQEAALRLGLDPQEWRLGQGTIYPDTIESGDTADSQRIKTHHNRAPALQALLDNGAVVEPLRSLYKDEVRELGHLLSLPLSLIERHPFPGPGLAIRCLCSATNVSAKDSVNVSAKDSANVFAKDATENFAKNGSKNNRRKDSKDSKDSKSNNINETPILKEGELKQLQKELESAQLFPILLPIRSVGVQGDRRSYRHSIALASLQTLTFPQTLASPQNLASLDTPQDFPPWGSLFDLAHSIVNRYEALNRVLLLAALRSPSLYSSAQSADDSAVQSIDGAPDDLPTFLPLPQRFLTPERIRFLQQADHLVHTFQLEKGIYKEIWQFPVVLLPITPLFDRVSSSHHSTYSAPAECLVLRPVISTDAMTAAVYQMQPPLLFELVRRLFSLPGCAAIFYDLTSKPPGTIEWE